jgi:hypothetical protein
MMRFACLTTLVAMTVAGSARADTITLNPNMIANVHSGDPLNYGGGPILIQPSSANNQGLLSFDLSAIKVPVAGATLKIYQTTNIFVGDGPAPPEVSAGSYDIYRNTSAWQQNTVTWTTKPSVNPTSVATQSLYQFNMGWQSWDVTSLVNTWIMDPSSNFGLTIGRSDPGTPAIWLVTGQTFLPGAPEGPMALGVFGPPNPLLPELILHSNAVAAAPEPASLIMAGIAALGLIGYRSRRPRGRLRAAA